MGGSAPPNPLAPAAPRWELQEPENAPTPEQVQDEDRRSPALFREAGLKSRQKTFLEMVK